MYDFASVSPKQTPLSPFLLPFLCEARRTPVTINQIHHFRAMSSGSSSSRVVGLVSSRLKCRCGTVAVVRTAKTGDNAGMKFYGCPKWPMDDCGFFQWINVSNGVDGDLRFKLFEKETFLAEKEMEVDFLKDKMKALEKKLDMKTEELNDTKMELSHTRIELMKAARNEKNFSVALFVSWIFFAMFLVYLKA